MSARVLIAASLSAVCVLGSGCGQTGALHLPADAPSCPDLAPIFPAAGRMQRGQRVAIVSPNRPEVVELECAFYKLGLVKVALNARLAPAELADTLANAEPAACIAGPEHRALDAASEASKGAKYSVYQRVSMLIVTLVLACSTIKH